MKKRVKDNSRQSLLSSERFWHVFTAIAIFLFTLILFTFTLPNTNTGYADSDEFLLAAKTIGVVHPPGYPLYTMLTIFISYFPLPLTFAGKANFLSLLLEAGVVVNFFLTFYVVIKTHITPRVPRLFIAGISSLFLGTMQSFWFHGQFAEVFTLHGFLISCILLLFILLKDQQKSPLQYPSKKTRTIFFVLASACGFAFSNQQAMILFTPLLFYLLLWVDNKFYRNWRLLVVGVLLFVGSFLLPYSYLPLAAQNQSVVNYENPQTLQNVLRSITRKAYTESLGAAYFSTNGITTSQRVTGLQLFTIFLTDNISFILILFSVSGIGYLVLKRNYAIITFCVLGVLGGGLVFAVYSPPAVSLYTLHELGIHQRFYLMSLYFISIFVGFGGVGLYTLITRYDSKYIFFVYVILSCILLYNLSSSWRTLQTLQPQIASEFGHVILKSLPQKSILICFSEPTCFTTLYIQQSENLRKDIVIIPADMNQQPIEQLKQQHPDIVHTQIKKNSAKDAVTIVTEIIKQNIEKRSVFVAGIEHNPTHLAGYHMYNNPFTLIPQGCVLQVARKFTFKPKSAACVSIEKHLISHQVTPKIPLGNMFGYYLGYQRYFNFLVYAKEGCLKEAKQELQVATQLNPLLLYIKPKIQFGKINNCLERQSVAESL